MSRDNPKPPKHWALPKRPGGTAPLGSDRTTVGRPRSKRPAPPARRDPLEAWVTSHLAEILEGSGVPLSDWTGRKLGEGSFGLVYELRSGDVCKIGFDYSESWFLHNLTTFLTTADAVAADALPRAYHFSELSHLDGWEELLNYGSPVFYGPSRDSSPFVWIREDVRSFAANTGVDGIVDLMLDQSAGVTRGSMERYEKVLTSSGAISIPKLDDGLAILQAFVADPKSAELAWAKDDALWQAKEALEPIVYLLENLSDHWEVYLPDARGSNAGRTTDGRIVLRDLGWVYAPQYHEWDVVEAKSMVDLWD